MKKALEGLKGVTKVEMDVEHDLFRVTLVAKDAPTQEGVFAIIKDLNYTPTASSTESFQVPVAPLLSKNEAPEAVRLALGRAKVAKKLVLVDLMGDN